MNYENKILKLFNNNILTTADVVKNNIPRYYLTKLNRENKIRRVSRGLYTNVESLNDKFLLISFKSKYVVFSNMTALYLLGLSERIPIKYDVTVKAGYKGSLQNMNEVNLFYSNKNYYELGIIAIKDLYGNNISVYDLEKSICDIIKNKNKLDRELFNKAIRKYYYSKNKNTLKLYDYAKKMNIYEKVRSTFEVLSI